jgi:hypothetical protein
VTDLRAERQEDGVMVRGCVSASWQLVVVAVLAGLAAAAGPEGEARRGRRAAGSGLVGGARSVTLEGVEKVSTTQDRVGRVLSREMLDR